MSVKERAFITLSRPQPAQILRETGMFSAEYFNTPLGDSKIPAPIMVPVVYL